LKTKWSRNVDTIRRHFHTLKGLGEWWERNLPVKLHGLWNTLNRVLSGTVDARHPEISNSFKVYQYKLYPRFKR
jgi:hypothetical protein